ncbi:MAG: translocation/assembly module TamB [Bacteroides sp.]|nr:translocation/assembly module TamB [Bacteroides sp.]
MKTLYRILRFVIICALVLPLVVPLVLYVVLSLPEFQQAIAHRAERELSALLGSKVTLGEVSIAPFNRVVLSDVAVCDTAGVEALSVGHIGAGISLWESLWLKRPQISYVELIDMNLKLYKDSASAPINIQPIIDRFKSDGSKGPSTFDLAVNLVVIRRSGMSFDILDAAPADSGHFDKNHIAITDLRADVSAPRISDKLIDVELKRLGANERSGISLKNMTASVYMDENELEVNNFLIEAGDSRLALNDMVLRSPFSKNFKPDESLLSSFETLPDTYIILSDLSPFVSTLAGVDERVDVDFELNGILDTIQIKRLDLEIPERDMRFSTHGVVTSLPRGRDSMEINLQRLNLVANVAHVMQFMQSPSSPLHKLYDQLSPLKGLGNVNLLGDLSLTPKNVDFNGSLNTSCGNIDMDCGLYKANAYAPLRIDGHVGASAFNPSALMPQLAPLTLISFEAEADMSIKSKDELDGSTWLDIPQVVWGGYTFTDIGASAKFYGDKFEIGLSSSSPYLDFTANGGVDLQGEHPLNEFYADIRRLSFEPFVKSGRFHDYDLSCGIDVSVIGRDPDSLRGWAKIENFNLRGADGKSLDIAYVELEAVDVDSLRNITLRSPQVDADLSGMFSLKTIGKDIGNIMSSVFPALVRPSTGGLSPIDCNLNLTVKEDSVLSQFFKLPIDFIYPVTMSSYVRSGDNPTFGLSVDMPFLRNKNKLIEASRLSMLVDGAERRMELEAHTSVPTKDGKLDLKILSMGYPDSISTDVSWIVDRAKEFKGNLNVGAAFSRDVDADTLVTDITVNKSKMVFNDSMWTVNPATIHIVPGRITVNNLSGERYGQSLSINGVVSSDSIDNLVMKLNNIDLDYIFESLNMSDAVQFGGIATGDFYAFSLLSNEPVIYTPRLKVEGLKYNKCVMGNGDIRSYWNHENKSIVIDAVISQPNGKRSLIDGYIKPMSEELDFRFQADKAPIGFMAPFMSAFTSKVSGHVSGNAHLYGTFKNIDMEGDIFAEKLAMKLDFTNVTYTATDSVHITPGQIKFDNIKLTDPRGKVANLSGYVRHEFFHDPVFQFRVTDARDFLVYDEDEDHTEDPWSGKIFGNGKATVKGGPGKVDIDVDMTTAGDSQFKFMLTDSEQAVDYKFITLRDRDKAKKDSIAALDPKHAIMQKMNARMKNDEENIPSVYTIGLDVEINPNTTVTLVMDPSAGDCINANGVGKMQMKYTSEGDMTMYGDYTIERGKYHFTLQDIIVKDFEIRRGSKIKFFGDPYAANLDIAASISLQANLSELDESFIGDRELNRTYVKVDVILYVKGDIRQPEISFGLDFPNLSEDVKRKINSIISTEDMKTRQVIYLLALGKFYTPDYMSGTHGNELMSVASSTLSSQLSSMLGQLSDNWSIAPAIRSDRTNFSDVEVDLGLSSNLLNNRLLLNGNLGYRDNTLNSNNFIGDFDIRYLLNRAGTIQLKAYNRYNDQNYYLKSALTTQGIGLVFRRDFDNIFSFLRGFRKKSSDKEKAKEDTPDDTKTKSKEGVLEERRRIPADSIFNSR